MRLRLAGTCIAAAAAACLSRPTANGDGGLDSVVHSGDGSAATPDATQPKVNYVFVSAEAFPGPWANMSPESGSADASCTRFANMAGYPGYYMAWLSYGDNAGNNIKDRLSAKVSAGHWQLPNGALFADTVEDIVTGAIQAAPDIDENLQVVTTNTFVATGTAPDGTYDGGTSADCPAGEIEIGDPKMISGNWTADAETTCTITSLRLYCFGYSAQ